MRDRSTLSVVGVIPKQNPSLLVSCGDTLLASVQRTPPDADTAAAPTFRVELIHLADAAAAAAQPLQQPPPQAVVTPAPARLLNHSPSIAASLDYGGGGGSSTETFSLSSFSSSRSSSIGSRGGGPPTPWRRPAPARPRRRRWSQQFLRLWARGLRDHMGEFNRAISLDRARRAANAAAAVEVAEPAVAAGAEAELSGRCSPTPRREDPPTLELGPDIVAGLAYHRDSHTLLTASKGGTLKVWSMDTFECLRTAEGPAITSVAVCDDFLITGGGIMDNQ
ncbi:hypothetical protein HK405_001776, partial [Cladochytrium tenue]